MIETLQTQRIQTLEQVRRVAEGNEAVNFALADRASAYEFMGRTLVQFDYAALGKADKGAVKAYLGKMTGLSRAQLTRLMAQHRSTGRIRDRRSAGPSAGRPHARFGDRRANANRHLHNAARTRRRTRSDGMHLRNPSPARGARSVHRDR